MSKETFYIWGEGLSKSEIIRNSPSTETAVIIAGVYSAEDDNEFDWAVEVEMNIDEIRLIGKDDPNVLGFVRKSYIKSIRRKKIEEINRKETEEIAKKEIEEMITNIVKFGRSEKIVLRYRYETLIVLEKIISHSFYDRGNIFRRIDKN